MKKYSWQWFKEYLGISKKTQDDFKEANQSKEKPYKSAKLLGNTALFVLRDGSSLQKIDCSSYEWDSLLNCNTQDEMKYLIKKWSAITDEEEKVETLNPNWETLCESGYFEKEGDSLYMKGVKRSMPVLLANKFTNIYERTKELDKDDEFTSLRNFWFWVCLNPFTQVAEKLYDFLTRNDFKITRDGMFLAYRRVVKLSESTDLIDFVSNSYVKIKGWKKSPKNFWVWGEDDGSYSLFNHVPKNDGIGHSMGNLADLYRDIDLMEENRYTDGHTKTFDIRIGKVVSMPRSECTYSQADCMHSGLHGASKGYDYSFFGDTGILMLVNPMMVVGIGEYKFRTSEYLPLCTLSSEEERNILSENEFSAFDLQEYYAEEQLKDLGDKVKDIYMAEAEKDIFSLKTPEKEEVQLIIHNLQEIVKRKVNDIKK